MAAVNKIITIIIKTHESGDEHGNRPDFSEEPIFLFLFFYYKKNSGTHVMKEDDANGKNVLNPWEGVLVDYYGTIHQKQYMGTPRAYH